MLHEAALLTGSLLLHSCKARFSDPWFPSPKGPCEGRSIPCAKRPTRPICATLSLEQLDGKPVVGGVHLALAPTNNCELQQVWNPLSPVRTALLRRVDIGVKKPRGLFGVNQEWSTPRTTTKVRPSRLAGSNLRKLLVLEIAGQKWDRFYLLHLAPAVSRARTITCIRYQRMKVARQFARPCPLAFLRYLRLEA